MPGKKVHPNESSPASTKSNSAEENKAGSFFLPHLSSNAIAVRIKELDECCCADVPCISIVKEYCESSSLHGLKYITEDGRHWTERVLWIMLCLCGFILTVYFIHPIWARWNEKPTITTLDSTDHPVWEIDYPAVTICPANKVVEEKLRRVLRENAALREFDYDEVRKMMDFLVGLRRSPAEHLDPELKVILERLGLSEITRIMAQVLPSCSDLLPKCFWHGKLQNCSKIFQLRKTNDGFCCTFNALRLSENIDFSAIQEAFQAEDLEKEDNFMEGFAEFMPTNEKKNLGIATLTLPQVPPHLSPQTRSLPKEEKTVIRRLNSASYRRGLTVLLDSRAEEYFIPSDEFVGFKVLVHNPRAYPEVEGNAIAIGRGKEYFISIEALHTDGSKAIIDFPFEGRSCLFKDERNFLKSEVTIFKEYSQENCLLECRAKLLLHRCGCLPYFYPRLDLILKSRPEFTYLKEASHECGWKGWECIANSTELLDAVFPFSHKSNVSDDDYKRNDSRLLNGGAHCLCPPACARTTYSAAQSSADFPNKASKLYMNLTEENDEFLRRKDDLSLIHVFFKDLKVFKYHTDELFSWENILASFGGLIGLCTGFSFLSAAEFAYFFTLRCTLPICRRKRRNDKVAMIQEEDLVVVKVDE